jgi:hypothetical protein
VGVSAEKTEGQVPITPKTLPPRLRILAKASKAWLRQQVAVMAGATAILFAHLGLETIDEAASELGVDSNLEVGEAAPRLPKAGPQDQNYAAQYARYTLLAKRRVLVQTGVSRRAGRALRGRLRVVRQTRPCLQRLFQFVPGFSRRRSSRSTFRASKKCLQR